MVSKDNYAYKAVGMLAASRCNNHQNPYVCHSCLTVVANKNGNGRNGNGRHWIFSDMPQIGTGH
ncbi:hypothetical protein [Arenibacter certesii]|uniref:hypothetical protein n=1 Tax=Arenibacter certesii TaxID=228955 RepID=UPI0004018DF8|nr:hypothetical protein [Arenibacter certesii]